MTKKTCIILDINSRCDKIQRRIEVIVVIWDNKTVKKVEGSEAVLWETICHVEGYWYRRNAVMLRRQARSGNGVKRYRTTH